MLITPDTKLKYINDRGESMELSFFTPFTLTDCEEDITNDIRAEKQAAGHGETYISDSMDPRVIILSGLVEGNPLFIPQHEKRMQTVFNPTLAGTLYHTNQKIERKISCRVEETPFIVKANGVFNFEIDLIAHQPFWEEREKSEYIALLTKNLKFPLVIPKGGMVFGRRRPILETKVVNAGDVESGFRVMFKARSGTVDSPQLINKATGEFIRIEYQMQKGESIEVLNYPDHKDIIINGLVDGSEYLDIESDFFNLLVGDNLIGYRADENTINLDVVIYYTPRYLGVQ